MSLFRRGLLALTLAVSAGAGWAQAAWPAKPIQLVVAFAPGGAGDIVARLVAKKLGEGLGQPVLVENKPVPVAAVSTVARARPDGYTLLMAGSGTALTSALFKQLPYDLLRDFSYVSSLASFDLVLIADGGSQFKTVADAVAFAKAHPGQLNIGTARVGSTQNLAAEMFKAAAGIQGVIVPYKNAGDLTTALRGRDMHLVVEMLPAVLGAIEGKQVRALAVTSTQRNPNLPLVPTLAESGLTDFEASSWNGIVAPAGTSPEIVARLNREIAKALQAPEVRQGLKLLSATPQASTPEQMAQRMRADIAKWNAVIDRARIPRQ